MGRRLFILTAFIFCATLLSASDRDTAHVEHAALWNSVAAVARQNPAVHGLAFRSNYSEMAYQMDYTHQSAAFVQELGSGQLLHNIRVNTHLWLNSRSAVWGSASYMTGRRHDVRWNSTSDYELLAPYALADTLGGDTHRERYGFSGGYATRLGKWLLGGEAIIRAEHEYRDVDPRMRGVVTDMTLRAGAGYEAVGYQWAAAIEGNVYKQTNSVEFYNELGKISEYQMTGLGTTFARFSGEYAETYYKGGGVGFGLSAAPLAGNGLYGDLNVGTRSYERVVTDANSLPITKLYVENLDVQIGWKHAGRNRFAANVRFAYDRRRGDENLIGKSSGQYYPILGKLTMYKDDRMDASLGALYGVSRSADEAWYVQFRAGWRSREESYAYPLRRMERSHAYVTLTGQWLKPVSERVSLTMDANAAYYKKVSDDIEMPYANMEAAFAGMVDYQYRFVKADYTSLNIGARCDYALPRSRFGLFAKLAAGMVFCSESERQTAASVTLGISF